MKLRYKVAPPRGKGFLKAGTSKVQHKACAAFTKHIRRQAGSVRECETLVVREGAHKAGLIERNVQIRGAGGRGGPEPNLRGMERPGGAGWAERLGRGVLGEGGASEEDAARAGPVERPEGGGAGGEGGASEGRSWGGEKRKGWWRRRGRGGALRAGPAEGWRRGARNRWGLLREVGPEEEAGQGNRGGRGGRGGAQTSPPTRAPCPPLLPD